MRGAVGCVRPGGFAQVHVTWKKIFWKVKRRKQAKISNALGGVGVKRRIGGAGKAPELQ